MAWNIGIMCVKGKYEETDDIIPDIFYLSQDNMYFEDATSVAMGTALAVTYSNSWIIIIDVLGRFITNDKFAEDLSKRYKVKTFWVSENLVYRDYRYDMSNKGGIESEYIGITEGLNYLSKNKIDRIDSFGETIIFQMIENEIFNKTENLGVTSLFPLKYSKYTMD